MAFLYSLILKLLYPTSLCLIAIGAAVSAGGRRRLRVLLQLLATLTLLVPGNGWLVQSLTRGLERQFLAPHPMPSADCIVVLGGGTAAALPPRAGVEVTEAGDRVLHASRLFRQGLAPRVLCTSGVATGGLALRPPAEDMAELLELTGVPRDAILLETASGNTREHARNLSPVFQQHGFRKVLLVTSAMHMPRAMGVFRRHCPDVEFVPAPTDFRIPDEIPAPLYRQVVKLIPTPSSLLLFSEASHEWIGMLYYRARGWM